MFMGKESSSGITGTTKGGIGDFDNTSQIQG